MKKIFLFVLLLNLLFLVSCTQKDKVESCTNGELNEKGICIEIPVCNDNEELIDNVCKEKVIVCNDFQDLIDGECVNKPPVCLDNEDLINGECVVTSCIEGYELIDNACFEIIISELEVAIENTKVLSNYKMSVQVDLNSDISQYELLFDGNIASYKYFDQVVFYEFTEDTCYEYYYGLGVFIREEINCSIDDINSLFIDQLNFEWFILNDLHYEVLDEHKEDVNQAISGDEITNLVLKIDDGFIDFISYDMLLNNQIVSIEITISNIDTTVVLIPESWGE